MKNTFNAIITAIAITACASVANAVSIPTSDTLAHLASTNGSIAVGDKTFTGFTFLASGLTGFDANNITVTASIQGGIYYLSYGGNISLVTGTGGTADLLLNYKVTATAGLIDYIDQRYTGQAQGSGAFLSVAETANAGGPILAQTFLSATDISDFPGFTEVGDNLFPNPPQSFLNVTKDIGFGIAGAGFVTISLVEQSFHQTVPDGGMTVALLGGALMGLQVLRRKLKA